MPCSKRRAIGAQVHPPAARRQTRRRARATRCAAARLSAPSPDRRRKGRSSTVRCGSRGVVARVEALDLEGARAPAPARPPRCAAHRGSSAETTSQPQFACYCTRATPSRARPIRRRSSPRSPGAPARSTRRKCCGTAGIQNSCVAAHHHQDLRRRFHEMLHRPQADAVQIHHFAADQVGAIEILVIPLRQLAARHADLCAPQSLRLIAILDARPVSPSTRRRCGRSPQCGSSARHLPADLQNSVIEQALRRVRMRT